MSFLTADVKHLRCCQKLNAASLCIHSNDTKRRRFESSFMCLKSTSGPLQSGEQVSYCPWPCEEEHRASFSICCVTCSLLLHLHHLVSRPPELHPSSLEVTKLTLWRCWIQPSLLWSGCSGLLSGLEAGASFAAGGRGGHRCPGSEREASGGWWWPWWSGRFYSWSFCCHQFLGWGLSGC